MCGISGYFGSSRREPQGLLQELTNAQLHRGPDAEGTWISPDGCVGFAHRRLSVIDLSITGNQPMRSQNGRYIIVFNGEIYNFQKLKSELARHGHRFRSTSDTEVMLAAFHQWGVLYALPRFNGMFAAAVWDESERKGYLFRDRLGVKPLYYQWCDGTLYFSSELRLPFAQLCERCISRDALALFFRHGYVPAPRSIYEGIYKLLPGEVASISIGDAANHRFSSVSKYWDTQECINKILSNREEEMTEREALERLDETMRRSVRDRMIADVPLGAFLSGGIDSSLVVSYMQQVSNSQARTFTIGFKESAFNEAKFARRVAQHLGTSHTELIVTEQDALGIVPLLPGMYGEPFADSSQIPTYLVSKLTREHVTVALSGDGGDELFGGYNTYRTILKYKRAIRMAPKPLLTAASTLLSRLPVPQLVHSLSGDRQVSRLLSGMGVFSTDSEIQMRPKRWGPVTLPERLIKGASAGVSLQPFQVCKGNAIEGAMCHDLVTYLPDDILVKVDRASMAVSLEVRAPFCDDFDVFEMAWRIPFTHKMNGAGGKLILKKLLSRFIPAELTERPKSGFAIPLTKWVAGALKEWVADCVSPRRLEKEGYLQPQEVAYVLKKALQGDEYYAHKLWYICQFQSWLTETQKSTATRPCHAEAGSIANTKRKH